MQPVTSSGEIGDLAATGYALHQALKFRDVQKEREEIIRERIFDLGQRVDAIIFLRACGDTLNLAQNGRQEARLDQLGKNVLMMALELDSRRMEIGRGSRQNDAAASKLNQFATPLGAGEIIRVKP
jgi:hypothetical protein